MQTVRERKWVRRCTAHMCREPSFSVRHDSKRSSPSALLCFLSSFLFLSYRTPFRLNLLCTSPIFFARSRSRVQDIADSCGELLSFSLRLQPRSKSQFLFVLSRFLSNSQLLFDVRNPQLSHAPVVNATTHVLLSPPHSPPCLATRGEHFVRRERREEEEGHGHRGRRGHRRPEEGVHGLFNPEQLRKVVVPGTSIRAHQYHTLPYYRTWPTPIS